MIRYDNDRVGNLSSLVTNRRQDQGDIAKLQKRVLKVLEAFDDAKAENASLCAKNIDIDSQLTQLRVSAIICSYYFNMHSESAYCIRTKSVG